MHYDNLYCIGNSASGNRSVRLNPPGTASLFVSTRDAATCPRADLQCTLNYYEPFQRLPHPHPTTTNNSFPTFLSIPVG
jgi:hypothetical protein